MNRSAEQANKWGANSCKEPTGKMHKWFALRENLTDNQLSRSELVCGFYMPWPYEQKEIMLYPFQKSAV